MVRPPKTKAWPCSPGKSTAFMPCFPAKTMKTFTSCFLTTCASGMNARCWLSRRSPGNCGSPIETEAGWLVLSHGVGPLRTYCIGAFLLDHDDPSRVIGRLREPLLKPDQSERQGYVPNVVYTCGALLHDGELIIPYGMADHATGFATVPLAEVLAAMD